MPFSFRAGHTRHTRKRLTTVIANRGRVYGPKRPTTPAAATVNRRAIFARPYATARYARYSLFRAARIDPSVIWKHVWEVVRATLSTTRTTNSCAAAAVLTRRITADNEIRMTEASAPASRRPTNSGRDSEAIRISRALLRASAAVTSSTGNRRHDVAVATKKPASIPGLLFYSREGIFFRYGAHFENSRRSFDRRAQIDKY